MPALDDSLLGLRGGDPRFDVEVGSRAHLPPAQQLDPRVVRGVATRGGLELVAANVHARLPHGLDTPRQVFARRSRDRLAVAGQPGRVGHVGAGGGEELASVQVDVHGARCRSDVGLVG